MTHNSKRREPRMGLWLNQSSLGASSIGYERVQLVEVLPKNARGKR